MEQLPFLSLLIWIPILGGLWVFYVGSRQQATAKYLSIIISLVVLILSLYVTVIFNQDTHVMQLTEKFPWISALNIEYYLGLDGLSLTMVVLNNIITVIALWSAWEVIEKKAAEYMGSFLLLAGCMNGVFLALDAILFYVFWEALLIPMFLIIGIWGGPNRIYATIKFFLYTFFGSVFMLVAIIYLYSQSSTFNILELHNYPLSLKEQQWIFVAFFLAFACEDTHVASTYLVTGCAC